MWKWEAALHQSELHGRLTRREHKNPLKESQPVRNNSLRSDETSTDQFGLNFRYQVWRKPDIAYHLPSNTMPTLKHGGDSILLWGLFFSGRDATTGQS